MGTTATSMWSIIALLLSLKVRVWALHLELYILRASIDTIKVYSRATTTTVLYCCLFVLLIIQLMYFIRALDLYRYNVVALVHVKNMLLPFSPCNNSQCGI